MKTLHEEYPLVDPEDIFEATKFAKGSALQRAKDQVPPASSTDIRAAALTAARARLDRLMIYRCESVFPPYSMYVTFTNSITVVSALFATLAYPGFSNAQGGTMPEGYNIPPNGLTDSLVSWYFNAIAFFSSVVALFMSLGICQSCMTVTGRYVMERPTYRSSSMSFASHMLQLAAISTLAAFCCAAFVALPYNHGEHHNCGARNCGTHVWHLLLLQCAFGPG